MNKQSLISGCVLSVLSLMSGFVVHGMLLVSDYKALPQLFRSDADAQKQFGFMLLAHLMIGFGFTWMYRRNLATEGRSVLVQGLQFGAGAALLLTVPMYLIYFAVQPMPGLLAAKQILFDTVGVLAMGVVAAWLNR